MLYVYDTENTRFSIGIPYVHIYTPLTYTLHIYSNSILSIQEYINLCSIYLQMHALRKIF